MQSIVEACFHPPFPTPEAQNDQRPRFSWDTTHEDGPDWRFEIALDDIHPWLRVTHLPSGFVSYWEHQGRLPRLQALCRQNGEDVPPLVYNDVSFMHLYFMAKSLAAEPPRKS